MKNKQILSQRKWLRKYNMDTTPKNKSRNLNLIEEKCKCGNLGAK
jgi:hypothetical protein